MAKNKQTGAKYTTTADVIWKKFEEADKKNLWFEYECWHPDFGLCVRNTVMEYCQIVTREEVLKREADGFFNAIVPKGEKGEKKEFSPHYYYYMDDTDPENPEFFAVRKREVT